MKKIFLLILITIFTSLTAQRVRVISGDYNFLKDQKFIKVVFKYDHLKFEKKNLTEQEFLDIRIAEIEKAKGKEEAEKWKADWEYSKEKSFPDKFMMSWNKNATIQASDKFAQTKYTLIVEPTWVHVGLFFPLASDKALVSSKMTFVETDNPGNVLMVVEGIKATGDNGFGVPNNNDRIAECFAKTAKMLALKVEHYTKK
ncbi:hypothetical protein [Chryseobacterium sp. W4I1]|uniref:hypothetical protein n=1 Tax=Chryseobacterium sp. W4I1 TaxID=3042293 RepID=UPI0027854304|nr:hypothetical protein [Chryseobacterium sp. W4I1]MDQ0783529.1 hypothetical protein [Chryseobacterium sp. W4I1]